MLKLGFLLGAGASFPFGIPMMREISTGFIEYIERNRAHCIPLIKKIAPESSVPHDLEVLIERLENIRQIGPGLNLLNLANKEIEKDLALADELRGYLDMFLIETCERFDHDKVAEKLTKFVKFATESDAYLFSTNYDRLIEVAANVGGLICSDGFEHASTRPESKWNANFDSHTKLIKLHGSVNWYEEVASGELFRLERGYSLPSHEFRLTHGDNALRPLMIIPTLEKAMLKQPYSGLLTKFSDALKEIDIFVIIGSSLRDEHLLNQVIARSSELEVIIINPGAVNLKGRFVHVDATHAVPLGFEQFLDIGLAPFADLLDQLKLVANIDDRRSRVASFVAELTTNAGKIYSMDEKSQDQLFQLKSGSVDTILKTLELLGKTAHREIVTEVENLARHHTDEIIRVAAIDALFDIQDSNAAHVLSTIVGEPGPLSVRAEAALALQSLDGKEAREILKRSYDALNKDPAMASIVSNLINLESKVG